MDLLLAPLPWLIASALLLLWLPRLRSGLWRTAVAAVFMASAVLCTPFGANAILWMAERNVGVERCGIHQSGWPIVLLSAGFDHPPSDAESIDALNTESVERIVVARRLALKAPETVLVVSGGGPQSVSEAAVIATVLRQSGVLDRQLVLEQKSNTTWESAAQLRGMTQVRLVTSPAHMQRAAEAFQGNGIGVCASPTPSSVLVPKPLAMFWPGSTAVEKSETALHELAGRWVYRLRRQMHAGASRAASKDS